MEKDLERDLGLGAVIAVSMGAMIGSGIFILPGLAMAEAGPAVILAFVFAAILVVPAGLSIAELGTALPEAGGDYVYIERSLGPGAGTIAGLGTWLMLMFKGALALVGGMYYLELIIWLPNLTAAALVLATILIGVNLIGVKQTGWLQSVMVIIMVIILIGFVLLTIIRVDGGSYQPFFTQGSSGFLSAVAMVLVSYAGVTKVAAVAEEIERPGRNLPLGLLVSLGITTILYALIVFVLVGTIEATTLADSNVPMALAVEPFLGSIGVIVIVLAAMLALVSTANAGILTASRYPLALSRDNLIPDIFEYIHEKFKTPTVAIVATGGAMLAIIAFLPVEDIAKTAGAFQILVYILVCLALIAFRERDLDWYSPTFKTPGYPWIQLFGVISGIFIITRMEALPIIGAVGITIFGALWYSWYGSDRVRREGMAVDVMRREAGQQIIDETRLVLEDTGLERIVIPVQEDISPEREETLIRIANSLVDPDNGEISVIKFIEVPDQAPLDLVAEGRTEEDINFEEQTGDVAEIVGTQVHIGEIVTHDAKRAVVNYAARVEADLILGEREVAGRLGTLLGSNTDWILSHAPCDVVFVQNRPLESIRRIDIVTDRSPFNDPLKVRLANAIAAQTNARVRVLFSVQPDAPNTLVETILHYHRELDEMVQVPLESEIIRADNGLESISRETQTADIIMLSTELHGRFADLVFSSETDRMAALLDKPILFVHSRFAAKHTFLRPILDTFLFRKS